MFATSRVLSLAAGAFAATVASTASATIIAGWTIPTAFPVNPPPASTTYSVGAADLGDQITGSELTSVHALAAATYTSPAGNGSAYSFSSNNWSVGDYYEARLSTSNYTSISVSWDQARSSTGPAAFELEFSVDGTNFTVVTSYTVQQSGGGGSPGTWSSSGEPNLIYRNTVALVGAEDATSVWIRFRSMVTAASTGSNRIDNVMISGTLIPAPGAIALLGLAGLTGGTRRRR